MRWSQDKPPLQITQFQSFLPCQALDISRAGEEETWASPQSGEAPPQTLPPRVVLGEAGQRWGPWYSCGGESGKPLGMGTEVKVEGSRLSGSCRVTLDTA